mmetsp:Transcript_685/g.2169  ORF Transcript_685/g.2169 Transcript_685/m.2169 type:complete len:143 (-) Transcript_685:105-533(-)
MTASREPRPSSSSATKDSVSVPPQDTDDFLLCCAPKALRPSFSDNARLTAMTGRGAHDGAEAAEAAESNAAEAAVPAVSVVSDDSCRDLPSRQPCVITSSTASVPAAFGVRSDGHVENESMDLIPGELVLRVLETRVNSPRR